MNLILITIYLGGYAIAWRKAFILVLEEMSWGKPEAMDIIFSCFFATIIAIIYPLWFIPMALYHLLIKKNLEAWIDRNYK